jgi:hypothetical protein
MATDMKALVGGLYDLLEPVDPADRKKAIRAALTMLGEGGDAGLGDDQKKQRDDGDDSSLPQKTRQWMQTYGITAAQLEQVFHVASGSAEVIAHEAPGANTKQKTINAYVLAGISQLLATGEARFDDKAARAVCKSMGCYNEGNHATYIKDKGNVVGGSKDAGWTLTGPGLKAGADLVKGLATS